MTYLIRAYAGLLFMIGFVLVGGGVYLLTLHGSPYYLLCGIAITCSAWLLWHRRGEGAALYGLTFLATVTWALWETGADGWALMPRLALFAGLGLFFSSPSVRRGLVWRIPVPAFRLLFGCLIVALAAGLTLHRLLPPRAAGDPIYRMGMPPRAVAVSAAAPTALQNAGAAEGDWRAYGNDAGGTRFSSLAQITPANIGQLTLAWRYRLGPDGTPGEVTPLKVGRLLYVGAGDVIALDAETGKEVWRSKVGNAGGRGVAYYRAEGRTAPCAERIIANTTDARLVAVDALDGTPCPDFGTNGEVSLLPGMGEVVPGYYSVTSAPTIVWNLIVVGGTVMDFQYWGEPSGVIRAYDALSGKLAWAWDAGHPDWTGEPPAGQSYTRSTPNAWAPMSADEGLGLVYIATGDTNGTAFFGGNRRPFDEQYANAVVALDAATGKPRWSFQTVHHDLWDYDLASQPTLVDFPVRGQVVHALIEPTKRGEIFILDRATGTPVYPVEERAAPRSGGVPEDHVSATQPYSTGLPSFGSADLVESDMWGVSPLDQLWCRIQFREMRYEGTLTPPGLHATLETPGPWGGINWGGVAVDIDQEVMIVNSTNVAYTTRFLLRAEADKLGRRFDPARNNFSGKLAPQEGTPYGVLKGGFFSPLQVPCNRPPYGRLSAVNLKTGQLLWTQVFGTARDVGPFGIRSSLPLPLGTANIGGAVTTRSGIVFIGATQDQYLRAYETATGRQLWQARLPAGGNATPMIYRSPESGRQFVVIAAGGHAGLAALGDSIVAYALPKDAIQR